MIGGLTTQLAPRFRIEVSQTNSGPGKDIGPYWSSFIRDLTVDMVDDGANELTMSCIAWDYEQMKYVLIDDKIFQPGNYLTVFGGYEDKEYCLGRFQITARTVQYQSSGVTYALKGMDTIYRMVKNNKPKFYKIGTRVRKILSDIAAEYNLVLDFDEKKEYELIDPMWKQSDDDDWVFIKALAALCRFQVPWLDFDSDINREVLHFRRGHLDWQKEYWGEFEPYVFFPKEPTRSNILNFAPRFNLQGAISAVEVNAFDKEKKSVQRYFVQFDELTGAPDITWKGDASTKETIDKTVKSGASYALRVLESSALPADIKQMEDRKAATGKGVIKEAGHGDKSTKVEWELLHQFSFTPVNSTTVLEFLEDWFAARQSTFIMAEFDVVGDPLLWPKQIRQFTGFGNTDSGSYYVSQVNHVFNSSGYHCQAQARKAAIEMRTRRQIDNRR